jgi:hypothetical protein
MTLTIDSTADCDVTIRAYEFHNIQIGAIISLETSNNLKGDQLAIQISGISTIMLNNITYNAVEVRLLSSSNVTLSGTARRLDVTQLGRGTFDARYLSTDHATVFTNYSGLVKIKSNNYLSLTVNEFGDIIWCSPHGNITTEGTMQHGRPNIIYYCK